MWLLFLCGILLGLSAPGLGVWPLAWLTLIPALRWSSYQYSLKRVFWGGFLLGFAYNGLYCLWFFDLHPLTWMGFDEWGSRLVTLAGWLLIALEGGLLIGLALLLYRLLCRKRITPLIRIVLFSVIWVLMSSLLNMTPLAMPWALLEYTQAALWPMRWLAGLICGSGITLCLILHNAFWAEHIRLPSEPGTVALKNSPKKIAVIFIPTLLGILSFFPHPSDYLAGPLFQSKHSSALPSSWPIPVAVIQANLPIGVIRSALLTPSLINTSYLEPLRRFQLLAGTLVVFPEEGVVPDWTLLNAPLQNPIVRTLVRIAQKKKIYIAVGLSTRDVEGQAYNSLALISPNPTLPIQFYHKRRLVPFGEYTPYRWDRALNQLLANLNIEYSAPYQAGNASNTLKAGSVKLGALLCFELIDSSPWLDGYAWTYQRKGVNLLINASNLGWFHQNPLMEAQFLAIGQMRAAETGLPLVISSNTGISAVISRHGDLLIRTHPNTASDTLQSDPRERVSVQRLRYP